MKPKVERCALCDDRSCVQGDNTRDIYLLDGRQGSMLESVEDCGKRVDLERYLAGEISLDEAIDGRV